MSTIKGKRILITGGAAGIGKIMGRLVLEKGADLIIWDINKTKLDETMNELSVLGKVHGYVADVSNPELVKEISDRVKNEIGQVDILINNAGIVVGKYFHEHTHEEIRRTMEINSNALMHITLEFLPGMIKQNSGHICNIASSAGLTSNPKMSVYVASKWAAVGWSDSLRIEMEQLNTGVKITTVTPYYISTGMFDGIRSRIPIMKPEKSAKKIIRGIEKNRIYVSMPWSIHFVRFFQGILPVRVFDFVVGKLLGVYTTMEHFTGHKR